MHPSFVSTALALASVILALAAPTTNLLKRAALPAYALTYAPYTYLQSSEAWFPSDVATHLKHMSVEYNFKNVSTSVSLKTLNTFNSSDFLTSYDNVETNPAWQSRHWMDLRFGPLDRTGGSITRPDPPYRSTRPDRYRGLPDRSSGFSDWLG
jgi:hypothetical protein